MKTAYLAGMFFLLLASMTALSACDAQVGSAAASASVEAPAAPPESMDAEFTLQTTVNKGRLAYIGIGGEIDGVINPDLVVQQGMVVRLVLMNGDGMPHDLYLPDFDLKTALVKKIGDKTEVTLRVSDTQPGAYLYYCTVPGHRQAGQEGQLVVTDSQPES